MDSIDDLLRRNPKAAEDYSAVQDALATLAKLRAAGIAKGDQNTVIGRGSMAGIRPSRSLSRLKVQTDC